MRQKERIDRILSTIETIWKNNPDLRLGQLLTIVCSKLETNLFYTEDDTVETELKKYIEAHKQLR